MLESLVGLRVVRGSEAAPGATIRPVKKSPSTPTSFSKERFIRRLGAHVHPAEERLEVADSSKVLEADCWIGLACASSASIVNDQALAGRRCEIVGASEAAGVQTHQPNIFYKYFLK